MYLVEIKLGQFKIYRYVLDKEGIRRLLNDSPGYEYINIIKEMPQEEKEVAKVKKREKK